MYCPKCGANLGESGNLCVACGWREQQAARSIEEDPTMRALLPVGDRFGRSLPVTWDFLVYSWCRLPLPSGLA